MDLKNRADAMVIQTRKALEEHGGKVSPEVRGQIESAISSLEEKIKADDKEAIERALKELEKVSMELGKAVYEAEAAKGNAPGGAAEAKPTDAGAKKDDVIDAEFEVKDDKK